MTAPNMETITASLERSLQNCSSNNHERRSSSSVNGAEEGIIERSPTSDDHHNINNLPNTVSDTSLDLNSHLSLPYHWEQCLDLKDCQDFGIQDFGLMDRLNDIELTYTAEHSHARAHPITPRNSLAAGSTRSRKKPHDEATETIISPTMPALQESIKMEEVQMLEVGNQGDKILTTPHIMFYGTVDLKGNPVRRSKSRKWTACSFVDALQIILVATLHLMTLSSRATTIATATASYPMKLELVHRDRLSSNSTHDHSHRFHARMQRDVKRVASLLHLLSVDHEATSYAANDFGSDAILGMDQAISEYYVRIGIGSPPRSQYVVIDTGSDLFWVQCQPCSKCSRQFNSIFDPADSTSYVDVSCGSSICDQVKNSGCHAGRCNYKVIYADESYSKGNLALETLTFGQTVLKNIAIGCGHSNRGMNGVAGVLGIGGGSMSLMSQLGGQIGGVFSYCLVSPGSSSSGSLVFGRGEMPLGASWVPLLRNLRAPSFYYVGLSGIGVGGIQVPMSEDTFQLTGLGYGGVVMDTGTVVTRFPESAYNAFRDAYVAKTSNLPRASGVSIFDTCYNLSGFTSVQVPTVSFYFSGGPILTLPGKNILIPVDDVGTLCFAFASSTSGLSIIGNIQQEGFQITFDVANGFVGFGPNVC